MEYINHMVGICVTEKEKMSGWTSIATRADIWKERQ